MPNLDLTDTTPAPNAAQTVAALPVPARTDAREQSGRISLAITRGRPFGETHPGRPFETGNPGKPKGARNRATVLAETLLRGEAEGLMRQDVHQALAGDVGALKLCLERLVPLRRERTVEVDLPKIETAHDAAMAAGRITEWVGAGQLTPSEGQMLAAIVETQRRALETADLERRIAALEGE